ncbi:MAG: NAD(P)/FAD-dependent oxidoreductase [Ferruginibacter sp.]
MNTIRTPVCIVGAGPAGTTASIFLSKYGIEHVMVERKSLPFDKVCGESFAGRVMNVLNEIDPQWAAALFRNKAVIQSRVINCFWQPHKRKFKLAFPPGSKPFLKATRSFFDHALLQKARESALLTYIDNCNITEFKKQTDGVRLSDCRSGICIETNLVLMCVGDKTTSLHHIFPDYIIDGVRYLASRQYFEQVSYDDDDNATELYFYHNPFIYYIYTTRLPNNQAMVEIFTTKKYAEKMNLNLAYNLKDSLAKTERLKKRVENARPLGKPK